MNNSTLRSTIGHYPPRNVESYRDGRRGAILDAHRKIETSRDQARSVILAHTRSLNSPSVQQLGIRPRQELVLEKTVRRRSASRRPSDRMLLSRCWCRKQLPPRHRDRILTAFAH